MKMRFAVPHGDEPSVAKMPPCAIVGAQLLLLIQYWWSLYLSSQLLWSQQNMELAARTDANGRERTRDGNRMVRSASALARSVQGAAAFVPQRRARTPPCRSATGWSRCRSPERRSSRRVCLRKAKGTGDGGVRRGRACGPRLCVCDAARKRRRRTICGGAERQTAWLASNKKQRGRVFRRAKRARAPNGPLRRAARAPLQTAWRRRWKARRTQRAQRRARHASGSAVTVRARPGAP
jgi:hypothetical protein